MTVIVAATDGERWAMGCDGAVYSDGGTFVRVPAKTWEHEGVLFGCSGNGATPDVVREAGSSDPHVVSKFLRANPPGGAWRVLMVGAEIWELDDNGSINQFLTPVAAIGIGEQFCLGVAACLMREVGPDPDVIVRYIIKEAREHVTECRGEPTFLEGHA